MLEIIIEMHGGKTDRELKYAILVELSLLNKKIDSFMSQTSDLLAKLSDDLDVIGTTVTGIATEISDLKSGQDDPAVVAKLTDLEGRASAVGTALKALLPAAPPADGGDTPTVEAPPTEEPAA